MQVQLGGLRQAAGLVLTGVAAEELLVVVVVLWGQALMLVVQMEQEQKILQSLLWQR